MFVSLGIAVSMVAERHKAAERYLLNASVERQWLVAMELAYEAS